MPLFQPPALLNGRGGKQLLGLPTEILLKILSNLTGPELLSTALVASPFYQLVTQHQTLQYIVGCHKHGVVDCAASVGLADDGPGSVSAAHKLERLLEKEENWEELDGTWRKVPLHDDFFISDLQGGVFARGTYAAGAQPTEPPSGLRVHHLPTAETDATERVLTDLEVGDFMDLAVDPGQDLIVIIRRSPTRPQSLREVLDDQERTSYELLLLDMDGRPKRNAASDVLAVDVRTLYPPITASAFPIKDARPLLHIHGDTLAVMIGETDTMERDAIFAWNWRTGEELCQYFYERPQVLVSFCLLTPLSFLMTGYDLRSATPHVTLFAFASAFDGGALAGLNNQPWPVRQYDLPPLKPTCFHTSVVCLDIRSETAVSTGPRLHGLPAGSSERLFTADPRRGMVVVDIEAGRRLFHAHFLRSTLIDHLERALARPPTFVQRRSWDSWGSTNCHLAEVAVERACVNYSHGYRVVVSDLVPPTPDEAEPPAPGDRRWIVLADYNPSHLSRPALPDDGAVDNHSWTLHEFPNVVPAGDVFRRPVESRLPRRTRVLAGPEGKGMPCEAVMIDEDRLIVCTAATDSEPRTFHVLAM